MHEEVKMHTYFWSGNNMGRKLGRLRYVYRWKGNAKFDLREVECDEVDWISSNDGIL
jgi:hypothetical protein